MRYWAIVMLGLVASAPLGCAAVLGATSQPAIYDYNREEYDQLVELEQAARQNPSSAEAVLAYAGALANISDSLRVNLGQEDMVRRVQQSNDQLGAIVPSLPADRAAEALLTRVTFFRYLGDDAGAEQAARLAFQSQQSYQTGRAWLGVLWNRGAKDQEGVDTCAKTYELALSENVSDEDLAWVLEACLAMLPEDRTREAAYPQIPPETWESFEEYIVARGEARVAAREAERERDAQRQAEMDAASSPASAAGVDSSAGVPAGPTTVSVRLHNECPHTVLLFYGDKPKYGSGTSSRIGSNHVESHTFGPGDMLWIVDESGNGISSWSASPGASEVAITSSCTGFAAR